MILRISAVIVLLFSVLFWPFWISAILGLAGVIYFNRFWEGAIILLLSSLLYSINPDSTYWYFIMILAILIAAELTKKKVRFYNK